MPSLPDTLAISRLADERSIGKGGFALSSPAFMDDGLLDPSFAGDEEDAVAPPLEWTAPPPGAQEMVLVVEDADGPQGEAACHWLVWGIAPQRGKLLEGEVPPRVGKNAAGNSEYLLPRPPHEDEAHRYVFQLFAVDLPLTLMPGATREEVFANIENHVVAAACIVGRYKRTEPEDIAWEEDDDPA